MEPTKFDQFITDFPDPRGCDATSPRTVIAVHPECPLSSVLAAGVSYATSSSTGPVGQRVFILVPPRVSQVVSYDIGVLYSRDAMNADDDTDSISLHELTTALFDSFSDTDVLAAFAQLWSNEDEVADEYHTAETLYAVASAAHASGFTLVAALELLSEYIDSGDRAHIDAVLAAVK